MNNNRFDDAFSPVPELVHERFQKALREKNQMKISKTKRSAAVLAVALAIVLALAGVAYAATKLGILDYLVGGEDKASDNLKQSVQPIAVSATGDGIRVNLTGAVYDGDRLSLSFDMKKANYSNSPTWRANQTVIMKMKTGKAFMLSSIIMAG